MKNADKLPRRRKGRFWRSQWVRWWIQGQGKDGYSFSLLLVPLVGILLLVLVFLMVDMILSAVFLSSAMTLFLGIAGFHGAKRECLVPSSATRAVMRARMKQAAERFSSLGVGATVLAIFVNVTSVSMAQSGMPALDSALRDEIAIFIALVFLPVFVSGAVRKLAIARVEELEALRNDAVGTKLKFDRQGEVRAVVVRGPTGRSSVPIFEYSVLGFGPPVDRIRAGKV